MWGKESPRGRPKREQRPADTSGSQEDLLALDDDNPLMGIVGIDDSCKKKHTSASVPTTQAQQCP